MQKYLAWDATEKCWIPADLIAITGEGKILTRKSVWLPWVEEDNPITIVKSTGLKNKNSRVIYEGDILRPSIINKKSLYVVCWNQGAASFHLKPIGQKEGGFSLYINGEGYSPYEVIGNIYQNPEMLKTDQALQD